MHDNHKHQQLRQGKCNTIRHTAISKDVTIEDNVWMGNMATILPSVKMGEGAIIPAGSVVVGNIEKYEIAGGHPAEVFKYHDSDHYEKLKQKGKFH